jgi:hypothetical protein
MSNSTLITDYIGRGTLASRPSSPPVGSGASAFFMTTDTLQLFAWSGSAWLLVRDTAPSVTETSSFGLASAVIMYWLDLTSAAITCTLSASPFLDQEHIFKDSTGHAATHNFSLNLNGNTLDGASGTIVAINANYGKFRIRWNGTQWSSL